MVSPASDFVYCFIVLCSPSARELCFGDAVATGQRHSADANYEDAAGCLHLTRRGHGLQSLSVPEAKASFDASALHHRPICPRNRLTRSHWLTRRRSESGYWLNPTLLSPQHSRIDTLAPAS